MIPCPTPPNPLLAAPSLARAGAGGGPAVRVGRGPGGPAQEPGGSPGREGAGGVHVSPSDLLRHSKAVRVQNTQRRRWAYIPSTALSQPGFRRRQPHSKYQVLAPGTETNKIKLEISAGRPALRSRVPASEARTIVYTPDPRVAQLARYLHLVRTRATLRLPFCSPLTNISPDPAPALLAPDFLA